jgi:hypothetical protein
MKSMKTYMTINPTSGALKHLILGLAATAAFLTTGAMPAHGQLINPHSPALRTALQPLMRTNREKQFPSNQAQFDANR